MCFAKSAPAVQVEPQDPVVRHEANASLTKNSQNNKQSGFRENIKTSAFGLYENPDAEKKTLLGE